MTQDATSNSSPRIVPSPHFDTLPDQSISPDWCRFGVSPRNAPTSDDRLNRSGLSTKAIKLRTFTGPTPGMVIKRRTTGCALAFLFTALSRSSAAWHRVEWAAMKPSATVRGIGSVSPRCCELIAERLSLSTLANPGHSDAKGFQDAPDVSFEVLAQTDQPLACADEDSQPIRLFAADMGRRKPTGAGELRQPFRIGSIGLIESRRQALMRLAVIDAGGGQAQLREAALQPSREHPAFMHDPVRRERSIAKPTRHAFGIGRTSSACDGLAIMIDTSFSDTSKPA